MANANLIYLPNYPARIAQEFQEFNPKIVVLPHTGINRVDGSALTLSGDAQRGETDYYFPGTGNGYVDMGATAQVGAGSHTFVLVSRVDTFAVSSYPTPVCYPTAGSNILTFYSNAGGYSDIAIGPAPSNAIAYPLTQFGSVTGTWHNFVCILDSFVVPRLFCNGTELSGAGTTFGGATGHNVLGQISESNYGQPFTGSVGLFVLFDGILPDALARAVSIDPSIIFEGEEEDFWLPSAAPSGVIIPVFANHYKNQGIM